MKKFITSVPRQMKGGLKKTVYRAEGNPKLVYDETSFPIVPVINGYTEQGDEIELLVIITDNPNDADNLALLRAEVDTLCAAKGVRCTVKFITLPDKNTQSVYMQAFGELIGLVGDNDTLYACITFGTKPLSTVELMALRYARRLCKNTLIGCVVYGQMNHATGEGVLYDNTALVLLDDVINVMADAGVSDPADALRRVLDL